jgi:Mlc titration factor MtfA (ptsG expression regulator)
MFGWFQSLHRSGLQRRPLPDEWMSALDEHVPFFEELDSEERETFLEYLKVFVWEKHWVSAAGMEITEEVKAVIGAAAVRLVLRLGIDKYDRLSEIVVYPGHYRHPDDDDGIVYGEANEWGTVVLSWPAVLSGLKNQFDGRDTATHEFAHVLDKGGGQFNGTPELRRWGHYKDWAEVMSTHYLNLRERNREELKVLDYYGAQNEAEFFAVATESFFEKPKQMKKHTPELFEQLKLFYGWEPPGTANDQDD